MFVLALPLEVERMIDKLPTKLRKEPLIDAVFEMRFSSTTPASSVLPGFLFGRCDGTKSIESLPASELPKPIRDNDPNLQFAPLTRLHWNRFVILVGDRSLAVGCKLPYPGWREFKPAILEVVRLVKEISIVQSVQRFSMKYIDLIPSEGIGEQISKINFSVVIGDHELKNEVFSLRVEVPRDGVLNAVQITSSAVVTLPDQSTREGVIVDIDTIANLDNQDFETWLGTLPERLDSMHAVNKSMFFECLRQEAINALEPIYE